MLRLTLIRCRENGLFLKVIWSENDLFFLHEVTGGKKIGFGGGWSKVLIDGASVKEGLRKAFHQ